MADKRDILIRLLGEETVSRMAGRAEKGLDKFGDSLDATEKDAKDLDRQIADVEGSLKTLAVAFARTSDAADRVDISKAMRKQQAELNKLTKSRKLLPDMDGAGVEAAEKFGASFVARVGPLLARAPMGPAGAAIGAVLAVGVVPTLAAAVQGAVVGGVGIGGVIGGVALASKDARVQAAGKQLGENVMGDLEDSAARFVEPTIAGVREIQSAWDDVSGDIDGALAAASRYVEPLAEGVGNFMRELGPGLREAAEAAGPIVKVVSEELPEVGAALSDMLSSFSDDADTGAAALRALFFTAENGIDTVTGVIDAFSAMFSVVVSISEKSAAVMEAVWGWIPGMGDAIRDGQEELRILQADLDGTGEKGSTGGEKAAGGLQKVETAASTAAVKVETLNEAIARMTGENISAEQAQIRMEEAIDRAAEAGARNNDGIDRGTEKGRANRSLLLALAEASKTTAEAIFTQTGSQELANDATERGRGKFIEAARAMGVSKAEAIKLADKLFAIPEKREVKVTTPGMGAATAAAIRLRQRIDEIDRRIDIKATLTTSYGGGAHTGQGYSTGMATGGPVVGPGPKGVDSVWRKLAPGEHVLTDDEVDAAGGHSGVERIRAMLRGEGGSAAPAAAGGPRRGGGGGGTVAVAPVFQINLAGGSGSGFDRLALAWLIKAIQDAGGNPKVLGLGGNW